MNDTTDPRSYDTTGMVTFYSNRDAPWRLRLVTTGMRYGLNDCLVNEGSEPMVEFYDGRASVAKFGPRGQFVSRYCLSTIKEIPRGRGLNLDMGIDAWQVDEGVVAQVQRWLRAIGH